MRKMSKVSLVFLFLLVAITSMAFASPIVIKYAYVPPELSWDRNYQTNFAVVFKNYVERNSGGQIKVQTYPGGQLGGDREVFEGLRMGTIEMAGVADAQISGFFKESMLLSTPGLFRSIEEVNDVVAGPWGVGFRKRLLDATGVRTLSHFSYGFRNFTNNVRPMRVPRDAAGLK